MRAPVRNGNVRAYLETDLNDNNDGSLDLQIRHAYGTWKSDWGTLIAGQTWSTANTLAAAAACSAADSATQYDIDSEEHQFQLRPR